MLQMYQFFRGTQNFNQFINIFSLQGCLFFMTCTNTTHSHFISTVPINVNEWAYLAVTLSGTLGTIYINGTAVNSSSAMVVPRNIVRTGNFIGRSNWDLSGTNDLFMNALVDEFRIYSRSLSASEIETQFKESMTYITFL
jgi:hypothetical protein